MEFYVPMQTVKTLSLILLCTILLGACGLRGPLYLEDADPSAAPVSTEDSPLNMDSTNNVPVNKVKKKKGGNQNRL